MEFAAEEKITATFHQKYSFSKMHIDIFQTD